MLPPAGPRTGRVASFDDPAGYGELEDDDGTTIPFHCTAVADGSRTVVAGTPVRFTVVAGRLGRWEAASVTPV